MPAGACGGPKVPFVTGFTFIRRPGERRDPYAVYYLLALNVDGFATTKTGGYGSRLALRLAGTTAPAGADMPSGTFNRSLKGAPQPSRLGRLVDCLMRQP